MEIYIYTNLIKHLNVVLTIKLFTYSVNIILYFKLLFYKKIIA